MDKKEIERITKEFEEKWERNRPKHLEIGIDLPLLDPQQMRDYLLKQISLELYRSGGYSRYYCSQIADMQYIDYIEYLMKSGYYFASLTKEDIEKEIKAIEELDRKNKE